MVQIWSQCSSLGLVQNERQLKWDARFLGMAVVVARWSKDPSTQCGAVIVRPDLTIASVGFNGFARGCDDSPHLYAARHEKNQRVMHAELNAILSAKEPLLNCSIYINTMPRKLFTCDRCAVAIIQSGIKKVVVLGPVDESDWSEAFDRARQMYKEAGVHVVEYS